MQPEFISFTLSIDPSPRHEINKEVSFRDEGRKSLSNSLASFEVRVHALLFSLM